MGLVQPELCEGAGGDASSNLTIMEDWLQSLGVTHGGWVDGLAREGADSHTMLYATRLRNYAWFNTHCAQGSKILVSCVNTAWNSQPKN
jgi:hypothetical protein